MSNIFEEYFTEETKGLLKWADPITVGSEEYKVPVKVGLDILEVREDKSGNLYLLVEAYFSNGVHSRMVTYPFKAMKTQLTNLFGGLEDSVGHQVMVHYDGKKPLEDDPSKKFHSGYVEDLTPE